MQLPRLRPGNTLVAAIVLGFLADLLLWGTSWGLGFSLWVIAVSATLGFMLMRSPGSAPGGWRIVLLLLVMLGMAASWRDSEALHALDVLAAACCASIALVRSSRGTLSALGFAEIAKESIAGMIDALIGAGSLIAADRVEGGATGRGASILPVLRGILLAVPLVILFAALFAAADATFEYIIVSVLDLDLLSLFRHALVITVISWGLAGVLYGRFIHSPADVLRKLTSTGPSLGIIEVGLPVGGVVLLSGLFVITQLAYLFGGGTYVLGTPEITVAQYARRGFFELVAVAGLALPVLLVAQWMLRNEGAKARRLFTVMAASQLLLMAIIMASAFHRLVLYQEQFGLTESRFYAAALLMWIGSVCVIFAATVLRGTGEHFVSLSFVAGLLVVMLLNAINPDERIAEVNLSRFRSGATLDTCYLGSLSADAVPVLAEFREVVPRRERAAIGEILDRKRRELESADWRGWNVGRLRALSRLREADLD